jgi:hypothetical protein
MRSNDLLVLFSEPSTSKLSSAWVQKQSAKPAVFPVSRRGPLGCHRHSQMLQLSFATREPSTYLAQGTGLGSPRNQLNYRRLSLMKVCSIFSQVLKLFSRGGFEKAVKQHKAERRNGVWPPSCPWLKAAAGSISGCATTSAPSSRGSPTRQSSASPNLPPQLGSTRGHRPNNL